MVCLGLCCGVLWWVVGFVGGGFVFFVWAWVLMFWGGGFGPEFLGGVLWVLFWGGVGCLFVFGWC